jgi:hypothetical protein
MVIMLLLRIFGGGGWGDISLRPNFRRIRLARKASSALG